MPANLTRPAAAVLSGAVCAVLNAAAAPASEPASVAEVTKIEKTLEQLYNSPDPASALAYFDTSSIRMFDVMQPTEFKGEDFRKHFIEVMGQFPGGKVQFTDLEVTADAHLAFATSIQHFNGKGQDGKPYQMTLRVTDCLRKSGARWLIVHEHTSLALDPATFMSVVAAKTP